MKKLAVLAALLLAGCAGGDPFYNYSETVYLAKEGVKDTVQCGPYKEFGGDPMPALRQCVSDFQKAGYQRVAAPSK